jgi:DNA-binding NarL/FixJ family response regulator
VSMPKRVLVVDDHPAVALALKLSFKRDGRFEVANSARTAADGLRLLADAHAAILLDLHLPDLGGLELVQAFRERAGATPLILYSSADDTPEVDAVRPLVDAVALKSRVSDALAALERLTAP